MNIIIHPNKKISLQTFKEMWSFRDVLKILIWRDFSVRYKQTFLGVLWAIFKPAFLLVVFIGFFRNLVEPHIGNTPYPLFVLSGLVFWTFFSSALSSATESLTRNFALIEKIYIPRIFIPLSSIITQSIDFIISLVLFAGILVYYKTIPSIASVLLLPLIFIIVFSTCSGLSFFLSALNLRYRDVRYILPFFIQTLIFITPVMYPSAVLGNRSWLWFFNPVATSIETFRKSLNGFEGIEWLPLGTSLCISLLILSVGFIFFYSSEKSFADSI